MGAPVKPLPVEREDEFRALCKANKTRRAIGKDFGVSWYVVARWQTELGLKATRRNKKYVKLSAADKARLRKLWEQNVPMPEVAEQMGLTIPQLYLRRKALGLSRRPIDNTRARDRKKYDEFKKLWAKNLTRLELAEHFKTRPDTIQRWQVACGLELRPIDIATMKNAKWTTRENAILRDLFAKRARYQDMSAVLPGRTTETINRQALALGLRRGANDAKSRGIILPDLLAPRIKECLGKHGASPIWRIRDYLGVKDQLLVLKALSKMRKSGEVTHHGSKRDGSWELAR